MDVCLVCLILIFVTSNILRLPFVCLLYNQICQVTECIPELVEDSSFTLLSLLRKWEEWQGVKQTAPLISGGMNALCLPAFSESFEDFPVIRTADEGSCDHKDSRKSAEICSQGEEAWEQPKADQSGNISLSDDVLEMEELGTSLKYYMFHCRALAVTVQSQISSLRPLTFWR